MNLSDTDQAPYSAPASQAATVSDEAVQAALDKWHGLPLCTKDAMRAALTAALPHLALSAATCSVEVGEIEELLTAEMNRQFGSEPYIVDGIDNFPNHEFLPVDDTQLGVEFAFEFLKPYLSQIITKLVDVAAVREQAIALAERAGMDNANEADLFIEDLIATISHFAIRALSPAEPVDQWQDIATAPKDGTWIIAIRPERSFGQWDRVVIVCWSDDYKKWIWPDDVFDVYKDDINETDDEGLCKHDPYQSLDFTHWMPLPAVPTSKGGE